MPSRQELLDAIAGRISRDPAADELRDQATQLVMGHGNIEAEVVLIGEAPGKQEDEQGRPFIGASGKLLDALLLEAGLTRQDLYITNIVKYRPPNNRDPRPSEKAAFLPYLLEELAIIQPKVIVTLGRHSLEYFLPDAKMSDVHGRSLEVTLGGQTVTLLPLYHPAAALFNGGLRSTLFSDILQLPPLLAAKN